MLRNPNGLSFAVTALLGGTILADVLSLFATSELRTAVTEDVGGDVSGRDLAMASMAVAGLLQILLLLATATVFIIWFHRLRGNAEVWAGGLQGRTPGWAIGGWFIPLANLWIPRGIAADIWRASRAEPSAADRPGELLLLNGWWSVFVVDTLVARVAGRIFDRAESFEEYESAANWFLVSDALDIVAAVLAILFVRRLTSMQHTKATGMIPAAQ
ncbi:DUF4328 domain-containing protein [Streptomyces gardneri]|uniref:DUF4328 domain-containing protein n=1 Tax=Streptomyces gardneri TaxID=66892 RepID=A0A4Y3RF21_9ACTN|nr:DUF4328 domain-containing protein [Streptomyces gardneri]GEB56366.1 hypothetical protein SGA01_19710 [Streptomyces gardneri]GHH11134.1 hypothetical protein GCM10017674_56100 [Streptomyces gardneri]